MQRTYAGLISIKYRQRSNAQTTLSILPFACERHCYVQSFFGPCSGRLRSHIRGTSVPLCWLWRVVWSFETSPTGNLGNFCKQISNGKCLISLLRLTHLSSKFFPFYISTESAFRTTSVRKNLYVISAVY